jgi:hypothetical protein
VTVSASEITHKSGRGGDSDGGTDGRGVGCIDNLGTFLVDALTVIAHNHASISDNDCFGC